MIFRKKGASEPARSIYEDFDSQAPETTEFRGIFTADAVEGLGGSFDIDSDATIFKATFGTTFGSISFGTVAAPGLTEEALLEDLRVTGSLEGGGGLGAVDLVVLGPALEAGDADQDYDFDEYDIVLVQQGGKYLTGQAADWSQGDWDGAPGGTAGTPPPGNGFFDQIDLVAAQIAGKYRTGPYADQTTPLGQGTPIAANGALGDARTSIVYDAESGEVSLDAPSGSNLTTLVIDSASGIFTADAVEGLGGSFDIDSDATIFKATFGGSFGSISFGTVAAPGLTEAALLEDLRVTGSLAGGGELGAVDLVYSGIALELRRGDGNADGRVDIGDAYAVFHSRMSPGFQLSVWPSSAVSASATALGASFWFVNVIVAASGPSESAPSETETEYAGAASPPSCTNWMSPAVTCACVNVVIAAPGFATSSNCPPETPETVN